MKDNNNSNNKDEVYVNSSYISTCCGAPTIQNMEEEAFGKIFVFGICSKCLKSTTLEKEIKDERKH